MGIGADPGFPRHSKTKWSPPIFLPPPPRGMAMQYDRKFDHIFQALCEPFTQDEEKKYPKGKDVYYVTARTVMNRLDTVLGPQNWWDDYQVGGADSILCRLTIRLPDGTTLTKCDAGGFAGMKDQGDDDKSGYSDAFKRAAVRFGVARYLYGDGVPSFVLDVPRADTGRPEPMVAPREDDQGNHGSPQDQAPTQEAPSQEVAEPKSKGLDGNPFPKDKTFWNDILDEVNRHAEKWYQDFPDEEIPLTTDRVLLALAEITFDAKMHPIDPRQEVPSSPDGKPMTPARWAAAMNKVAKKSPEVHKWLKEHLVFFVNSQYTAAVKLMKATSGQTRGKK